MIPLKYNISAWDQLSCCLSNLSRDLHIHVTEFVQNDKISGTRIRVEHETFGVLFACVINAQGSLVSTDSGIVHEFTSDEILAELKKYGFDVDEFGFDSIIIRTHPSWVPEDRAEAIIRKIVDIIIDKGEFDFDKFVWRIAATTACRMSVMANTYISKEDEEWILENIRYCDNPFTCPHGRPTIITYSRYELERLFKRQLD